MCLMTSRFSIANARNGRFPSTNLPKGQRVGAPRIVQPFTVWTMIFSHGWVGRTCSTISFWNLCGFGGKYFAPQILRFGASKQIFIKDRLGQKNPKNGSHHINLFLYIPKVLYLQCLFFLGGGWKWHHHHWPEISLRFLRFSTKLYAQREVIQLHNALITSSTLTTPSHVRLIFNVMYSDTVCILTYSQYYVYTITAFCCSRKFTDPGTIMLPPQKIQQQPTYLKPSPGTILSNQRPGLQVIRRNSRTQVASLAQLRCLKNNMLRFEAAGSLASEQI